MNNLILLSIISTTALGIFFASILAVANKTLKIEEDPRILTVENILPGLNCGACGYAGCQAFAMALVKGEAPVNSCLAGGEEMIDKLAASLGIEKKELTKQVAVLHCNANANERTKEADYKGIETCLAANLVKGITNCTYGCIGFGDCSIACPFGAITMIEGLPRVAPDRCTSCGKCIEACPRKLFSIERYNNGVVAVACSSADTASRVRKICKKGCIACKVCEKLSEGVFKVEGNLARVDYQLAKTKKVDWEKIMSKCPTKVIIKS